MRVNARTKKQHERFIQAHFDCRDATLLPLSSQLASNRSGSKEHMGRQATSLYWGSLRVCSIVDVNKWRRRFLDRQLGFKSFG